HLLGHPRREQGPVQDELLGPDLGGQAGELRLDRGEREPQRRQLAHELQPRSASWSMVSAAVMRPTLRRTLTYVTVLLLHGFMAEIPEAYVFDDLRTPRGRGKASGSLYEVKPVSLVVGLIDEMRARHPELDTAQIDDVVLGVVSP